METLQTIEIKNQLHRAETYLNAYQNEKPNLKTQIMRLNLLITYYEELLRRKGLVNHLDMHSQAA